MKKTEYLLNCLSEECGEVVQAVAKCQKFGLGGHHPDRTITNKEELMTELAHVQAVVDLLRDEPEFESEVAAKIKRLNFYMGVSKDCGILEE